MCDEEEPYYKQAGLESKMRKKIMDLQEQLLKHYAEPGFTLHENDLIRYTAMIDVLKAMLN